ncbi:hypothetical protein KUTeg_014442 [Tegillarca granosa]|uniref:Mitochondrial import receptor subunit TOM20 homolog n=1 Tax=Tegillarca granosa TaxID=220873 RepID=A0ABQ9F1Z3_TEGGR|nr:hypothetical protein KUTeg_014442 [Tegillarca granosa]
MLSRTSVGIAAAGAGLCFLGYCIYFDRKRRSDPLFKQKLRENNTIRRRNAKQNQRTGSTQIDTSNPEAMSAFFLKEIQLGEDLLSKGDIDGGAEHLSTAVAVCGNPQQLLSVLQQTLPPQILQLVIQKLPAASQLLYKSKFIKYVPSAVFLCKRFSSTAPPEPAAAAPTSATIMELAEDDGWN